MEIVFPVPARYEALLAEISLYWFPLPDKPEETPQALLSSLWLTASGIPASAMFASKIALAPLCNEKHRRLQNLIHLRKSGVPLAHLTQRQHFLGLEFLSSADALIPRKETEILGRAVLGKLESLADERGELRVMDLCTGSGNLALAYAHHQMVARVHGSDLSHEALSLARRNAVHLALDKRVEFFQGDLFAPFDNGNPDKYDILSCNPPYVSTANVAKMHPEIANYEPAMAFDGGYYGSAVVAKLIRHAPRFLKPSSWLAFEVGLGAGEVLARKLEMDPAFCLVEAYTDTEGHIRALLAKTRKE
ncbi:MAG: hypothetical protein RLZZ298_3108 [Pseudomonadota bacterium]|jgi:release factor glutamine methyltransferase